MIATSDALRHELRRIDALLDALRNGGEAAGDDVEDFGWLTEQRIRVGSLLAMRRAQRGKRLVSLAVRRSGCASRPTAVAGRSSLISVPKDIVS